MGEPWEEPLFAAFTDLRACKGEEARDASVTKLETFIYSCSRDFSGEAFTKFLQTLNQRIKDCIESPAVSDKICGVLVIDRLLGAEFEENITNFCNLLHLALQSTDSVVLARASHAVGKLALSGGTLCADGIESELAQALDLLTGERKLGGILVLKELAINAPVLFYVHVPDFIKNVSHALYDKTPLIRGEANEALDACLSLCKYRESNLKQTWFQTLYEDAKKSAATGTPEGIHGCILTFISLLRHAHDFLQKTDKYHEICKLVINSGNTLAAKQQPIRRAVIVIMPQLAKFMPSLFANNHLNQAITFLLAQIKTPERPLVFLALGETAQAVGADIMPYFDQILSKIREALVPKSKHHHCPEALSCLAMLANAVGSNPANVAKFQSLLNPAFAMGLSPILVNALRDLKVSTPSLIPDIHDGLLHHISMAVGSKSHAPPGLAPTTRNALSSEPPDAQLVVLALNTLGSFDFGHVQPDLLDFVVDCFHYLDDDDPGIRQEAAITFAKLILRSGEPIPSRGHAAQVVAQVLQKLLMIGIADPEPQVRRTVLKLLDPRFDQHLAQAENLRSLFTALNDECFDIRKLTIDVIGRLTSRNPAFVMPSLRKTLIQLLTDLEYSGDNRNKEESAILLGQLINSSDRLVKPYVEPILKTLLNELHTCSSTRVASCVIAAIGELAVVGGADTIPHLTALIPPIIETLRDQSATAKRVAKREVALHTLGLIVRSTGFVIEPLLNYPTLLETITHLIATERSPSIRTELLKVWGILGAVDPYKHKHIKQDQQPANSSATVSDTGVAVFAPNQGAGADQQMTVIPSSSDEFYPAVVVTALMRILKDPNLSVHHALVLKDLMLSLRPLGMKCILFLPHIMPVLLQVMKRCEAGFRVQLFECLAELVSIVKQHVRDYLAAIFELIMTYWESSLILPIVSLAEEISLALNEEFKAYLPSLMPLLLKELRSDRNPKRQNAKKILEALEVFGNNIEDYLHLVIPAVVAFIEQEDAPTVVVSQAIDALCKLCRNLNFSDYSSRMIHPLARQLAKTMSPEIRDSIMKCLCTLVRQLGTDFSIFIPMINKIVTRQRIQHADYDILANALLHGQPVTLEHDAEDARAHKEPSAEAQAPVEVPTKKYKLNTTVLQSAWETVSQRTNKEDWSDWIRLLSGAFIRECPAPALRACAALAQDYPPLTRELFNAVFLSCWTDLPDVLQAKLISNIETALNSKTIPNEILQTLLNLAEYMEHEEKMLPIANRTLGNIAQKCHAYAKALHYKEKEFLANPRAQEVIEDLISINHQLEQPEAAIGIVLFAQNQHKVELQETWYEKLGRWEDALLVYTNKLHDDPTSVVNQNGRLRCLHALGEWEQLSQLSLESWQAAAPDSESRRTIAPLAAAASWNLGTWDRMEEYVTVMNQDSFEGSFYRAILEVYRNNFIEASRYISQARNLLDTKITALVGESYERSYNVMVNIQQLAELEEVIEYKQSRDSTERLSMIRNTWKKRLLGCKCDVDTWQQLLSVHTLVVSPQDNMDSWLKFVGLCRKSGRLRLAFKTLNTLVNRELVPDCEHLPIEYPHVAFAYVKTLWSAAKDRGELDQSFKLLQFFKERMLHSDDIRLKGRTFLKLGDWQFQLVETESETAINEILASVKAATECGDDWYKAWHAWALINFEVVTYFDRAGTSSDKIVDYLVTAVQAFFKSISLRPPYRTIQDTLRLLTLLFKHGQQKEVEAALREGIGTANIDTWLQVIPQIIARIHSPVPAIHRLTHDLLTSVGKIHPQALVYPLTVASKSPKIDRLAAAQSIIDKMRKQYSELIDQALMVSEELIRVAILWLEKWHEGLEEASRYYFTDHNVSAMIKTVKPLHEMLEKGPETPRETAFLTNFGHELKDAWDWCKSFQRTGAVADINQAWEIYYHVFKRIGKQLTQLTTLELQNVSPKLLEAHDLKLAVPGTYRSNGPVIQIARVAPNLSIISSKQRPRKLTIIGSNQEEYKFLLKGHEDLRQDERVMQLFRLVNDLLANHPETSKSHLKIRTFEVVPLSHNSGLIEWVPHSDTLHALIREYREGRMLLNIEHKLMGQMAPQYDLLTLMQKVEVFQYALDTTEGSDLERVLWNKSRSSEVWLERRTNYTRSVAVMSMVGYILGLGDRHPSNLMLERDTGQVIHIDFGDCFEVAMHREKFPEKIPFRLTRMLISAMEVSGIEGNFRFTCEKVMRVLRLNKDTLMAVLETFAYDPLINWRLLAHSPPQKAKQGSEFATTLTDDAVHEGASHGSDTPGRHMFSSLVENDGEQMDEVTNQRAVSVIKRVSQKLTGRDFGEVLDVPSQVDKLIKQATSHENLCQCYIGWCPFWRKNDPLYFLQIILPKRAPPNVALAKVFVRRCLLDELVDL
eukprot:TRINITY_DN5365_c0_g1_i1.p1 TRINITY_DN5365_c0_g1~~TRINITY_DN5365_c0_g1_i1.p1  ORF type:complete len:2426 (-),score=601.66 TRINITY_DN5365_c0_g1_i1:7080-14204(-)